MKFLAFLLVLPPICGLASEKSARVPVAQWKSEWRPQFVNQKPAGGSLKEVSGSSLFAEFPFLKLRAGHRIFVHTTRHHDAKRGHYTQANPFLATGNRARWMPLNGVGVAGGKLKLEGVAALPAFAWSVNRQNAQKLWEKFRVHRYPDYFFGERVVSAEQLRRARPILMRDFPGVWSKEAQFFANPKNFRAGFQRQMGQNYVFAGFKIDLDEAQVVVCSLQLGKNAVIERERVILQGPKPGYKPVPPSSPTSFMSDEQQRILEQQHARYRKFTALFTQ